MIGAIISFLALLGGGVIVALVFFLAWMFAQWLKEKVKVVRLNHKIKHRFDKPPTAKCYCRDCVYYGKNGWKNSAMCCRLDRWVADDCFCYEAEPIKHERPDDDGGQTPQREDV